MYVSGPAGRLYVDGDAEAAATGPAILLVHGLAGSTAFWRHQLAHLRPGRRALALDLRGHGRSDRPSDGDYSVAGYAGDIAAAAGALGLQRFVLVGHSFGTLAALEYAAAHAGRVAALMLVDPPGDFTRLTDDLRSGQLEPFLEALDRDQSYAATVAGAFEQALAGARSDVRDEVMRAVRSMPRDLGRATYRAMFTYASGEALARYLRSAAAGAALAIVAEAFVLPFSLHVLYPALPHEVVRGTGHWLMMDAPDEFNRVLDALIASAQ
jgi:pimeloyl-ACP methyl ester carboxylesterase